MMQTHNYEEKKNNKSPPLTIKTFKINVKTFVTRITKNLHFVVQVTSHSTVHVVLGQISEVKPIYVNGNQSKDALDL
jgi:hypothetical protein